MIKRVIKNIIHKLTGVLRSRRCLGLAGAMRLFFSKTQKGREVRFNVSGLKRPVILREGTTDPWVFYQIMVCYEYPLFKTYTPATILDAGANIGTTSLHFLRHYPDASIIALEPDPENYSILQKNLEGYPQVKMFPYALWKQNENVHIANEKDEKYALRIESGAKGRITLEGKSVQWVLEQSRWDRINLFKIDIEGAEWDLFGTSDMKWIDRVDVFMIEMHEDIKPGCSKRFFDALDFDYRLKLHGGNLIVCRESFLAENFLSSDQIECSKSWNQIFVID